MNFKEKFTKYLTLETSESGLSETQIQYVAEMANSLFNQEKYQMIGRVKRGGEAYKDLGRRLDKINTSYLE